MHEIIVILSCILLGVFLGIFYNFFKYFKYTILDFIYWVISSFISILFIEKINYGIFRFYFLIFIIIGYIIYYKWLDKGFKKRLFYLGYYLYKFKKYLKWLMFPSYIFKFIKKKISNKKLKQNEIQQEL